MCNPNLLQSTEPFENMLVLDTQKDTWGMSAIGPVINIVIIPAVLKVCGEIFAKDNLFGY